ncbi:MAG: hypothetical protein L0H73_04710 [Nitrococcus sp.]|nr:hypothetical protein [Nitrococcus sp.]
MIRIKGWMILVRNATRDYLDFAALTAHAGEARTRDALAPFDALYQDVDARGRERDTLPSMQLLRQLAEPRPNDLDQRLLADYQEIAPECSDWRRVASQCETVAETLALSLGAPPSQVT